MNGVSGSNASPAANPAHDNALLGSGPALRPARSLNRAGLFSMNLPFIDRIWRIQGTLPLDEPLSAQEAFARLDPLLQTSGTQSAIDGDTLTYRKRNPAAQDKLATFTRGTLRIAQHDGRSWLQFDLSSTALLLCFLAPLLFLGFAQLAITINAWEAAGTEASQKAEKDADKDKDKPVPKLNPIDEMLGAPPPEDPNKKKDKDKDEGRHSPDRAYVLAGLFFVIYLVGRFLEPWLIRRTFRSALTQDSRAVTAGPPPQPASES